VSSRLRHKLLHAVAACLILALLVATAATAQTEGSQSESDAQTGGAVFIPPPPPPERGKLWHGKLLAPPSAPRRVKRVIRAANRIIRKPYRWGGGHKIYATMSTPRKLDKGYDCSGAVSYAMYGGRFLRTPLDSSGFMKWARRGTGRWITTYAHGGHAYVVVAGYRFDTSMHDPDAPGPGTGPRWSKKLRRSAAFVPRHPRGY
jgi:hypothetical protein